MTPTEELKNCPFCGKEPEVYKVGDGGKGIANLKAIACGHCNFGIYRKTMTEAQKTWNTRATRPNEGLEKPPLMAYEK